MSDCRKIITVELPALALDSLLDLVQQLLEDASLDLTEVGKIADEELVNPLLLVNQTLLTAMELVGQTRCLVRTANTSSPGGIA